VASASLGERGPVSFGGAGAAWGSATGWNAATPKPNKLDRTAMDAAVFMAATQFFAEAQCNKNNRKNLQDQHL
jgi:hypothetical protein